MSFNIGESVGPYRIIEQLGQGGMATVYKAYHAALDRYVALKVLHPAFNEDRSFLMRFQREARVVAKLEHAHIVPIYDYAEHDNRPYLVMKFIEGETLKARIGRGALSTEELNGVVSAVGSALAHAHKRGILHRDIKPSNVLIGTDGAMYLADFGLARIAQAGESTLSTDSIMGTPQYISPEQAMGKKELDEGTDIYSFGVMLYELVVGQVPFNADTPFSIIHDHIYSPLPMPSDINPNVPDTVQRVLLKALAKERKDRYDTINALVKAFREAWTAAGVPMRGTTITVLPSMLKKAAAPALSPQLAPQSGEGAAPQTVAAKTVQKKKRPVWAYAAGGVLILFCCLFAASAFRKGGFFGIIPPLGATGTSNLSSATNIAQMDTPIPHVTDAALPTLPPPTDASPEITTAKQLVKDNPGDPDAHLKLALAFWDTGQPRLALETLNEAANLGKGKRDFLLKAAEAFAGREAWIPASGMYLRLINLDIFKGASTPDEVLIGFHEAIYKASEQPEMPTYILFERIEAVDQPMALVARSRHTLYNGSPSEARIYLNEVNSLKPAFEEALLLEGEIDFREGRTAEAKQIFGVLRADLGAPDWLRRMAEDYYRTTP